MTQKVFFSFLFPMLPLPVTPLTPTLHTFRSSGPVPGMRQGTRLLCLAPSITPVPLSDCPLCLCPSGSHLRTISMAHYLWGQLSPLWLSWFPYGIVIPQVHSALEKLWRLGVRQPRALHLYFLQLQRIFCGRCFRLRGALPPTTRQWVWVSLPACCCSRTHCTQPGAAPGTGHWEDTQWLPQYMMPALSQMVYYHGFPQTFVYAHEQRRKQRRKKCLHPPLFWHENNSRIILSTELPGIWTFHNTILIILKIDFLGFLLMSSSP